MTNNERFYKRLFIGTAVLALLVINILMWVRDVNQHNYYTKVEANSALKSNNSLTLKNVLIELLRQDVRHPTIVLRQIILETNWLKCRNCSLDKNNLFGYQTKKGYIDFKKGWKKSVKYYKEWQDKYYNPSRHANYYDFLIWIRYAEDPHYIDKLKSVQIDQAIL